MAIMKIIIAICIVKQTLALMCNNKPQSECIYTENGIWNILSEYFSKTTTIAINVIQAPNTLNFIDDFFINFHNVDVQSAIKLHIYGNGRNKGIKLHEASIGYIVVVTNRMNFTNIFENKLIFTSRTPFFIFYFTAHQRCTDIEIDINQVLTNSWNKNILNLLINTPCSCNKNEIYSFDPFHNNGTWGTTKRLGIEHLLEYPGEIWNDLTDFRKYPIRVSMFQRIPTAIKYKSVLNHGKEDLNRPGGYKGIDGLVLQHMAIYLNFTPVVFAPNLHDFGEKLENGTYSGSLGDIIYGRADLSANARFVKDYKTDKIEFTKIVGNDLLCLVVPKSQRMPQWTIIFHSFSIGTWLLIFLSFIFVLSIWHLLNQLESYYITKYSQKNTSSSFLLILSSMFLVPQRIRTNSSSKKILLAACMLLNIILIGIFQGSLATSFSVIPYYKEVNTLEQFLNTKMLLSTNLDAFNNNDSKIETMLRSRLTAPHIPHSSLDRAAYQRDVAAVERRTDADLLVQTKYLNSDGCSLLHVVEECPKSYLLSYIVPKGFPFLEKFNMAIQKFSQAGLLSKWHKEFINKVIMKTQYELNISTTTYPSALNLDDLQTAFYLLVIGIGISTSLFVCEFVVYKLKGSNVQTALIGNMKLV